MRAIKQLLILSHRYVGIPLSFMFVLWFFSAYVMIYAGGMPKLTPAMQIDAAEPLQLQQVRLGPDALVEQTGYSPSQASLRTVLGRPVYELRTPGFPLERYYADTGEAIDTLSEAQSRRLASEFLGQPQDALNLEGEVLSPDQWTLTESRSMPMYKYSLDDAAATEIYVSPGEARVVVATTDRTRLLSWLGTIPHWLYYAELRLNQPLWYQIMVWAAGIGTALALLGLVLGVVQFRKKVRPFKLSRAIPYHGGMRWHYILGLVFGVTTLTWVFSGLVSMEPFAWTNTRGVGVDPQLFDGGELDLAAFPALDTPAVAALLPADTKRLDFVWKQGRPHLLASHAVPHEVDAKRDRLHQPYNINGQSQAATVLLDATTLQVRENFDQELLVSQLAGSVSEGQVTDVALLDDYDDYYYSRQGELPLPVLRVKFDDPMRSWIYVDPHRAELLSLIHKNSRVERWLYNGLHSLDFAFWYHKRPLWDIGVLTLLTGGFLSSLLGLYFGLRRLKYDLGRAWHWVAELLRKRGQRALDGV
ncbi:MAG TPA: hypothetical protein VNR18_07255 [Hyphomicrobiales bacterium]|nr:hypothetical protein [Hyphomicrobiales bacterium]